jgi:hypothetical protein
VISRSHQPALFNGKMRESSRASPRLRVEVGDTPSEAREDSLENGSSKAVKPEIAVSVAEAQAIVGRVANGRMVAQLRVLSRG